MTRTQAIVLRAAAIWTFYIWITRIWNIVSDPGHTTAFKLVHSALALVSVAFAVAILVITAKVRRGTKVTS
ncbi:MAG TPA: hypothetical protein VHJ78_06685 [Actinomycetota bacterium]|nr:hypothetical protein [Actinomycetota bacterium]